MVQLRRCSTNPNHWYSGHSSLCPWCRIFQDSGKDTFPQPGKNPGSIRVPGYQQQTGAGDSLQDLNEPQPAAGSPSFFQKNAGIAWAGLAGIIIILLIVYAGAPLFSAASTHASPAMKHTAVPTVRTTTSPTVTADSGAMGSQSQKDGFRIYTSQDTDYSLDYPESWTIKESGSDVSLSPPGGGPTMQISTAQKSGTLQDFLMARIKEVDAITGADITNHNFKCTQGYRLDYVIPVYNTSTTTKVTEIFMDGHSSSQVFVITYRGIDSGYDAHTGDFDDMVRSFQLK
jgi:hypothetical protein